MNNFVKPALGSQIDPQHPISQGLVMALCMLEGAGNRTYDLTHNGNDGVFQSGPLWKPGRNGTAISFDGVNDYVDCGNDVSLNPTTALTMAAWIKSTGNAESDARIVAKRARDAAYEMMLITATGRIQIYIKTPLGGTSVNSISSVNDGEWHFIAVTRDEAVVKIYIDGMLDVTSNCDTGSVANKSNLYIGRYPGGAIRYFNGIIDDVRIWNRALSAQEVQDLYTNPYGFIYQPKKYWLMPQGVTIPPHLFRRVA